MRHTFFENNIEWDSSFLATWLELVLSFLLKSHVSLRIVSLGNPATGKTKNKTSCLPPSSTWPGLIPQMEVTFSALKRPRRCVQTRSRLEDPGAFSLSFCGSFPQSDFFQQGWEFLPVASQATQVPQQDETPKCLPWICISASQLSSSQSMAPIRAQERSVYMWN